jgi:L-aminopeptidase/D-esterase-like protein
MAAQAMERAIVRAVQSAQSAYGLMGYREIQKQA